MKTEEMPTPKKVQQLDLNFESPKEREKSPVQVLQEKQRKGEPLTEEQLELLQILLKEEREDDQYRHGH